MGKEKIGILGGTFDPPHFGHLMIAQEVLSALKLDKVWFMPTNIPPHKELAKTSGKDRIEMVQQAIKGNAKFELQPIEFERTGPSYTYDTMKILRKRHPQMEFYFIIGADMVEYLPRWQNIDELVKLVTFVGVKRPGYQIRSPYRIIEVEIPPFDISSSFLRDRLRNNENTKYYIPDQVRQYIEENKLYGSK